MKRFKFLFMFFVLFGLAIGADFAFNKNDYTAFEQQYIQAEQEEKIVIPSSYCIRDDYYLVTTNQHSQGLCWNFSSSSVLTTAVMKSTNQYIDYSEGWISEAMGKENSYYLPGDGGTFGGFDNIARIYGVVQEQDFNYEESYQVCKENVSDMHEYFEQFSDTTIMKNYKSTSYNITQFESEETILAQRNAIKKHILTQSALYVSFSWASGSAQCSNGKTVYFKHPNPESTSGGHALTVVGWDDDIEVVFNSIKYKGAWIFVNSWGNTSGNEGMYYIFYDDTQVSYFNGYTYTEEYDDLYFYNKLVDSTADFETNKKGAYTGDFEAETNQTKQKNIFTNPNNVRLTYSYKISPDTEITDISVYNFQKDVTKNFNITNNTTNNTITINAKDELELSTYKIVFTYSNGEESESICGAFSIINGTETEFMTMSVSPSTRVNGNFVLDGVNPLNNGSKQITYSVANQQGSMNIWANMATYSKVYQMKIKNSVTGNLVTESAISQTPLNYVGLSFQYNLQSTNHYHLILVGDGVESLYDVYLLQTTTDSGEKHARINYTLFGGENNEENLESGIIGPNKMIQVKSPTKEGYGFAGWYYSKDCEIKDLLKCSGLDYYIEFDRLIHYEIYSVGYWATYNKENAPYMFYSVNIYAKWVELKEEVDYCLIFANITGGGLISDVGVVFVPKYTDKTITIDSAGYIVTQILIDGNLISSEFYNQMVQNGISFNNISSNHTLSITFTPRTDIVYHVSHWLQAVGETDFEVDGKYYQTPITEEFIGTTGNMTNATAKTFSHFVVQSFEQQKISGNNDTVINIYYTREVFNITITFSGVKYSSAKYDINEEVLYGQTKTYNLCPKGYTMLNCVIDGQQSENNSITFEDIAENHEITVSLKIEVYNIQIDEIQNGSVVYKGNLTDINLGEIREFTFVADEGYVLKQVTVNDEVVEIKDGKLRVMVSDNLTIGAEFEELPDDPVPDDPNPDDPNPDDPNPDDPVPDDPAPDDTQDEEIPELPPKDEGLGIVPIIFITVGVGSPVVFGVVWILLKRKRIYY